MLCLRTPPKVRSVKKLGDDAARGERRQKKRVSEFLPEQRAVRTRVVAAIAQGGILFLNKRFGCVNVKIPHGNEQGC